MALESGQSFYSTLNTTTNKMYFLGIVTLISIFPISTVDSKKEKGCLQPKAVAIDPDWLEKRMNQWWWGPLGSKLQTTKDGDDEETLAENNTLHQRSCWTLLLKSPVGAVPFPMNCRYNVAGEQNCEMKTEGTPVHKFVRFFGGFTATLTDHKTYVVVLGCLLGNNDYWVTMQVEKTIDDKIRDRVLDHVETMGFSRENLKSDKDYVSIERTQMVRCRSENKEGSGRIPGKPGVKRQPAVKEKRVPKKKAANKE